MPTDISRKEFLAAMSTALLPYELAAEAESRKVLIVVAHPDDEYAFSAAIYRLVRELGWTADQVVITNGEAGYRYSALAEAVYGVGLTKSHLPKIRKEEAARAGKILGIRRHYFLDQKDLGFATDAASADSSNWDRPKLLAAILDLLARERYHSVFTLLPTERTHGHHRAAASLALEAVSRLPEASRPLVFGVEARSRKGAPPRAAAPAFAFDRATTFGYRNALSYQVIVNWVIAEHKSQGLFQMDYGRHDVEEFWLLEAGVRDAARRVQELAAQLCGLTASSAYR